MNVPSCGIRLVIGTLVCWSTLTGCASLPDSSTPEAIGTIEREPPSRTIVQPIPGREPDLLLRDFFAAVGDPANRHLGGRQYLTAEATAKWDDSAGTVIVDRIDVLPTDPRTDDRIGFLIRGTRVGQLQAGGIYLSEEGSYESKFVLRRENDQWRIDQLPDGVVLDSERFRESYKSRSIYFVDPSDTTTVADPRWVSVGRDQLATQLIGLLIDGPKAALAPAVHNMLDGPVSVRGPITKADGRTSSVGIGLGGIRIDFGGIAELDHRRRDLLAAQVVWTLANADVSGPYVLLADGKPLDDQHADSWTTADVAAMNPQGVAAGAAQLHALRGGALVSVVDDVPTPIPGVFGSARNLRSVAVSRDTSLIAAVADTGLPAPEPADTLLVGSYDGQPFPVAQGATITRPTWAPDNGSAWAVVDGTRVIRAVRDMSTGQVSVAETDTTALIPLGRQITELRLSRDGVRAALIIDGKAYVAVVVRSPDGGYSVTSPRPIAVGLGAAVTALDWSSGESVVLAQSASENPVTTVPVDGSRRDPLPGQNLTPPVGTVSAVPGTIYVADSRAVFRLDTGEPERDRFWREVRGLTGGQAVPVLPG
ncbi:MtrAB system accessory lipoprotein LpqB [Skermania piniformis]|uniref:MtrAB system accessory lipoprotein LpqB n=1 Tax=Skermania pinensis TaxID=39122 RepID=UPI000A548153